MSRRILAAALAILPVPAFAEVIAGGTKQPLNLTAVAIFLAFVVATLGITKWAAARTRSTSAFLTAGVGISGFQNGQERGVAAHIFESLEEACSAVRAQTVRA